MIAQFERTQYNRLTTAAEDRALEAMRELLTHIDTLEQTAAERVIADGGRGPTPDYTGEGSAWVPPVEARGGVVVPKLTASDLFGAIGRTPANATWGEIVGAINDFVQSSLRTIPADRVLGEGEVAVDRKWVDDAVDVVFHACKLIGRQAPIWEEGAKSIIRRDPLRANQGGAAT